MNKLLTVGTVAFDAIETPLGKTDKILGGAATYISLAASQFDINTGIVSIVGADFPEAHFNLFKHKQIDTSGIVVQKNGKTFFWQGKYHENMNVRDTLITELNVLADFNPIVPEQFKNASVVMLGNLDPKVQLNVLNQMEEQPKLTILDTMNFWMDNALDSLLEVIKRVDVLTINDEEAQQLTNERVLTKAAKKIFELGPKYVIIKKGEHGAMLFHEDSIFIAPAFPLEIVYDPTGAGDTFAGGFAGYLAETQDFSFENMKKAVVFGTNLAAFCVESFGTQNLENLSTTNLINRLNHYKTIISY